jgi:hypothetical protein
LRFIVWLGATKKTPPIVARTFVSQDAHGIQLQRTQPNRSVAATCKHRLKNGTSVGEADGEVKNKPSRHLPHL